MYETIIIGSGPAGYVSAIRSAQMGNKTAIVEKGSIGGMCLNWGCIPSKVLIETAKLYDRMKIAKTLGIEGYESKDLNVNWKKAISRKDRIVKRLVKGVEHLMKKNNIDIITGEAKITGEGQVVVGSEKYNATTIIIATGSVPRSEKLTSLKDNKVLGIKEFYDVKEIPESVLVYGGNPASLELAMMLSLMDKNVSITTSEKELIGFLDEDVKSFVQKRMKKKGIKVYLNKEHIKDGKDGVYLDEEFVNCEVVIDCSDRIPVFPEMENLSLEKDNGYIKINEYMQTTVPNIYAIGDVTGKIFAQIASAQGVIAINHAIGINQPVDYSKMPVNIYFSPEIASVGLTEEQVKDIGEKYRTGTFPLSVNGKAMAEGETDGFVKVIAEEKYGEVLGVHIVSPNATDMIHEAVALLSLEATLEDIGRIVHAHPTISETFLEAGFVSADMPLHI